MKDFFLADGPVFRHMFYTTAMAYDRREREPFPPVNVYLCENHVLVQALLPGLAPKDITVRLEEDVLLLEGNMPRRKGRYFHEERYSGHFRRRITLGVSVQPQAVITAEDGILQIKLSRR